MTTKETIQLVEKLIEMTQNDILVWSTSNGDNFGNTEKLYDLIYDVNYLNQNIRIYKYKFKVYSDELTFHWLEDISLELVNNEGFTTFNFPKVSNIEVLLNTVMYKTSNVNNFFNSIVNS